MKMLLLSSTFPYPPTRGGTQVRTFNLLKYLSQRHSITLVTRRSTDVTEAEIAALRECVEELAVFPAPSASIQQGILGKMQRFGTFLQQGTPPSVMHLYSAQIQQWIDQAVAVGKFEVITCEHCVNEIYVRPEWRQLPVRTVVNIHSSVYGTCKNQLETGTSEKPWRDKLNLGLLRRYEQHYCAKFSAIVVTTEEDRQQIQFHPSAQIYVIPNGVDFTQFPYRQIDPGGHRLIFIGAMDNRANIDAVSFFSLEVFPNIQQRYPEATLELVGARPVPEVVELGKSSGITVTGHVASMVEYLHRSTVCVVPMRTGFGIKNKTLEAMAAGVPVVGSDRGLEGLVVDGVGVPLRALRSNRVEEYVKSISQLFEDAQLREQLSRHGRSLIESAYTWEQAGALYEQVLTGGHHETSLAKAGNG